MNKKTRKLLTWCLVFSMILTQMLFTNVAFAATKHEGADRYATAAAIATTGWTTSDYAVLATGEDYPDALAAAPLAKAYGAPILLTTPTALSDAAKAALTTLKVKNVIIVGGEGAVSKAVADAVAATGVTVTRIMGADRVETALNIAKALETKLGAAPTVAFLATSENYADALAASPIAAAIGAPILLATNKDTVDANVATYIGSKQVYVLGGTGVITDATAAKFTGSVRLGGADRYATSLAINQKFTDLGKVKFDTVFVATGENYPDALAGSVLAAKTSSILVLVNAALDTNTANFLKTKATGAKVETLGALPEVAAAATAIEGYAPAELKVESVTALNLKQMEVKFNMAVDQTSAEDVSNYDLVTDGSAKLADATFALQDDNKTVIITFKDGNEPDQQEVVSLTVDGVLDTNENALAKVTFDNIEFLDTTLPVAENAEVIGIDTVKVTFSEPIKTISKDDFEIKFGDETRYIKGVTLESSNKVAKVQLYKDLTEGKLSVALNNNIEDYAGFGLIPKTFSLDVVKDTTAPEVIGYEDATPTGVTLIFNEDIKVTDTALTNFYHTNTKNEIDSYTIDGNKLTLDFTTNELPKGTAYVYIEDSVISDYWENENAAKMMVKVEVTVDETKPTLDDVTVNAENNVTLNFSEDVANVDKTDFTVVDSDGTKVSIKRVTTDGADVTLDFYDNLSGTYTVTVQDLEDVAGNVIDKVSKDFTVADETAPVFTAFTAKIYNPGQAGQNVVVNFGEAMIAEGQYSVLDLAKYTLGGKDLSSLDCNVKIKLVNSGKSVEIRIPSKVEDSKDGVDFSAGNQLVIGRVADAAGNYTAALASGNIALAGAGTVGIDSVKATAKDTIEITFTDELTDFNADDLIVYADNNNNGYDTTDTALSVAGVDLGTNDDGVSVATITLDNEISADALATSSAAVRVATVTTPTSVNAYGDTLAHVTSSAVAYTVTDGIAPALAVDTDDNSKVYTFDNDKDGLVDTIVMQYDESIDKDTVTRLTYTVDDIAVTSAYATNAGSVTAAALTTSAAVANGEYVVLHLDEADVNVDTALDPSVVQKYDIEDLNSNVLAASTDAIATMDMAAPTIESVEVSGKVVTVFFAEDVKDNTSTLSALIGKVRLSDAGSTFTVVPSNVTISGNVMTITLGAALTSTDNQVQIGAGTVKDVTGNVSGVLTSTTF